MLNIYGEFLAYVGRAKEGAEMINRAFRLNPHVPSFYYTNIDPFYATAQYNQVVTMVHRFPGDPQPWMLAVLAMSYAQLGQQKDAVAAVAELARRFPDHSFERLLTEIGEFRDELTLARST
jgi:predicted Zn-dependent protease